MDKSLIEQLREYFRSTPADVVRKEWEELSKYDDWSIKISDCMEFDSKNGIKNVNYSDEHVYVPIGEKFKVEGNTFIVSKSIDDGCKGCCGTCYGLCSTVGCMRDYREDKRDVIFKLAREEWKQKN